MYDNDDVYEQEIFVRQCTCGKNLWFDDQVNNFSICSNKTALSFRLLALLEDYVHTSSEATLDGFVSLMRKYVSENAFAAISHWYAN